MDEKMEPPSGGASRVRPAPKGQRSKAGYRKLAEIGAEAFRAGQKLADCPYKGPRNPDRWAWLSGWCDEEDKARPRAPEPSPAKGSDPNPRPQPPKGNP